MNVATTKSLPYLGACIFCVGALFTFQTRTPHEELPKPPVKTLSAYSTSLTDVPSFGAFGPTKCDVNGDMYFHLDNGSYSSGTIMRLERSSLHPHVYKVPADLGGLAFFEFSVSPLGKVRLLEQKPNLQYEVLSFDSDTGDVDQTHLQIPNHLWITDFVASEAGTLLVGGYYEEDASKDLQGKSFLALLEPSGRVRKDFSVEGPSRVDLSSVRDRSHDGAGTVGPDGNFYRQCAFSFLGLRRPRKENSCCQT